MKFSLVIISLFSLYSLSKADIMTKEKGGERGKEEHKEVRKEEIKSGVREAKKTSDWSQVYKRNNI